MDPFALQLLLGLAASGLCLAAGWRAARPTASAPPPRGRPLRVFEGGRTEVAAQPRVARG